MKNLYRLTFLMATALCLVLLSCAPAEDEASPQDNPRLYHEQLVAKRAKKRGTALIIMDMQNAYMPLVRNGMVFANVAKLINTARGASAPIVWVYTDDSDSPQGSPGFEIAPPLKPELGDMSVVKEGQNAFAGTGLAAALDEKGVGRLVFCGIASDGCVAVSVSAALGEGYRVVVAEDAHSVVSGYANLSAVTRQNEAWRRDKKIKLQPTKDIPFPPNR